MYRQEIIPEERPIEFKQISHSDFEGYHFDDENVTEIISNEDGYISDFLLDNIKLNYKDTTIINASVGQGKTTAIINFVKEYYARRHLGYVVILVSPFKSLIDQYNKALVDIGIPADDTFDYRSLDNEIKAEGEPHHRPVQLFTFNFIMGNPGESYLKQNPNKVDYIDDLLDHYKEEDKKVVLIFDEIHDAVHNFKQELVFNLLRWRKVTHKIIVASATYNEASKVIMKYFAEMTDKKIKILEAPRVQYEDRLNELSILYYDFPYYDVEHPAIKEIFDIEIGKAKLVNVLTYSKSLSEKLINSEIGKKIKSEYGEINLCTADTESIFKEDVCNIGTNFKTGISITEENTAYYIFLPQKKSYEVTPNPLGIFNEGINSIIQALARPRKKARIYVVMPYPTKKIEKHLYTEIQRKYEPLDNEDININSQNKLLKIVYDNKHRKLKEEIDYLESDNVLIKTLFPSFDQFKILQGEKYMRLYYHKFGKNLSNYFYWAAKHNQFVNCKWKYSYKIDLNIDESNMLKSIYNYAVNSFEINNPNSIFNLISPYEQYQRLRNSIFSNHVILLDKDGKVKAGKEGVIKPYKNIQFEKTIIKFIQQNNYRLPYLEDYLGFNYKNYIEDLISTEKGFSELEPHKQEAIILYQKYKEDNYYITTEEYIANAMYYSRENGLMRTDITNNERELIQLYSKLYNFKDKLLQKYLTSKYDDKVILPKDSDFNFEEADFLEIKSILEQLKSKDDTLKKVFNFMQNGITHKKVYSLLKKLYFEVTTTKEKVTRKNITIINNEIEVPKGKINLTYRNMDYINYLNNYENQILQEYEDTKK